jgi:imidazole glycerol-phosphate synthase subunit HisH
MTISLLDYQSGNIQSVKRAVERIGGVCKVIQTPKEVMQAEKLILPGVGNFGKVMAYLQEHNLVDALNKSVLEQKTPVLGICLGMQLMCTHSEEGNADGLGWFDLQIKRMQVNDSLRYKIPHMGWNATRPLGNQPLFRGMDDESRFYFVHAYHIHEAPEDIVMSTTVYESTFVSSLRKDHIMGVQFHPEKSHNTGGQLIQNFIEY